MQGFHGILKSLKFKALKSLKKYYYLFQLKAGLDDVLHHSNSLSILLFWGCTSRNDVNGCWCIKTSLIQDQFLGLFQGISFCYSCPSKASH